MEYFYVLPGDVTPPTLAITGEECAHMTHVMRMREGDALRAVDGRGTCYDAVIAKIAHHTATCRITARHDRLHEPALRLTLGAGMLKNPSRFDYLVEKAVEVGASRIIPLLTERTIPRQGKSERWQKLCIAAMKQSGRCVLPEVSRPVPFASFIGSCDAGSMRFIPHEQAETPLASIRRSPEGTAVVCIGPEGGFTDAEVGLAVDAGFRTVTLGARRLRAETAAIVACALLLEESPGGEMRQ